MSRRVITAREQHQMLSPWRRMAGDGLVDFGELTKPTTLYRGVAILGMSPEQIDHINKLKNYDDWDGDPASWGKHLQIGPQIIQHLHEHQGGLGRYWTTNPAVAEDFAGRSMTNRNLDMYPDAFPAILKTHWDGTGLDTTDKGQLAPNHNFKEDEERVLQKGHPVKVHGLWVRGGQGDVGWGDVINPDPDDYDLGHLHIPGHYHPGVI